MHEPLRNHCSLKGGTGFPEVLQGKKEGHFAFIKVSDMSLPGNEKFITVANNYVDEDTAIRLGASVFPARSIVFAKVGAALLLNRRRMLTAPTIIDNNMMAAIPTEADPDFLFHFLCSVDFANYVQTGALPSINQLALGAILFPKLTLQQQRSIATILSTMDTSIEKTESLITKYQQIKAGLMHDLFTRGVTANGKLRPPREQAPELYHETPIGWIPKEWGCKKLGKILLESAGYLQTGPFGSQLHAHEYTHDGIPVVMPQDIEDGKIFTRAIARIPESRSQILARHRVKLGDIIIARRGELNRAASISHRELGWVCGTGCFLLRLSGNKLVPRFFSYTYRHDIIQRQIEGLAVGSTMPSLNNSVMSSLYFPYLTVDEQHRISDRLKTQDKALISLECEKEKLKKQKSGLMHDLLTGRVRVTVNEAEAVSGATVQEMTL